MHKRISMKINIVIIKYFLAIVCTIGVQSRLPLLNDDGVQQSSIMFIMFDSVGLFEGTEIVKTSEV